MKKIITLFVLFTTTLFYSQSSGITYQAVLHNPSGEILPGNNNTNVVLSNKDICLRFSITDAQTSLEYQETQRVTTDEFGMVNLVIGSGNQIGGYAASFAAILWNSTTKKLQVAIDVTGTCSNFVEISNQNFSAVPFAYASKTAESVSGIVPIVNGGTGSSTVSGAKTNLGLNNVDNTSDANKPISTAAQTALDTKESVSNKSSNPLLGNSEVFFPTQNAVKTYVDNQISSGVVDATTTTKGKIQLAGDLGGTADLPTVPGLASKEPTITSGTTSQYFRGDKTWQTLDKSAVGLSNVDNTSDASKPISIDTQNALDLKANLASPTFTGDAKVATAATGDNDTSIATTAFVNTAITNAATPNATTSSLGKIKLAGDLGGTADAPTVPSLLDKLSGNGTNDYVPKFSAAKTVTDSSIFDNGNVGIGTTTPANKLEITQGTAGNSGLRFTNLTSSSSASTSASKVLGLNNTGDVILTNIPGTQNIVTFSTATPTTSGVVFTPNTPTDQSVVYQSEIDNSLWTYNGTTYVTYIAPASTAWNLAGTSNDAGSNKTSSIWRTGNIAIGTNNPLSTLHVNNSLLATNTINANATVLRLSRNRQEGIKFGNVAQYNIGTYGTGGTAQTRLDLKLNNGGDETTLSDIMTWQANGNVGIGTTAPLSKLIVNDNAYINNIPTSTANLMDNSTFRPHTRFQNTVGANNALSLYSTTSAWGIQSHNYATGVGIPMLLQPAGGNVGIGTTSPANRLSVLGNSRFQPNTLNDGTGEPVWVEIYGKAPTGVDTQSGGIKLGWYNTFGGIEVVRPGSATGVGLAFNYATTGGTTTEGFRLTTAGNVGIGTTSPTSRFEVNGSATNTAAYNNGGSATAIAFSMSNLAYTTLSPQLFALTGIKDGGTYTLAVQGPNQGTSTFMAPGFTFRYVNNGPSIANTHTLYTFIVMGTTVYVYTTIGFTP